MSPSRWSAASHLDLRRSISQRPAGPGGRLVRNTAAIAMTRWPSGTSSIRIFTSDRFARSRLIASTGMPPQPRPARRKACFAPRSASRQVFAVKTPNSFPCESSERSVRTSCRCCARTRAGIAPLIDANGCVGDATNAHPMLSRCSRVSSAGAVGREPITPKAQRPSSTGCKTAPSASTYSLSGTRREFPLKRRHGGGEPFKREYHIHHDTQLRLEAVRQAFRAGLEAIHPADHRARFCKKSHTLLGQDRCAARPIEQFDAELGLEIRQRLTDDGLRSAQAACAGREASGIGRGDEGAKLIEGNAVEHLSSGAMV